MKSIYYWHVTTVIMVNYDRYGYVVPFLFSSTLTTIVACFVFFVLPPSKTFLSQEDDKAAEFSNERSRTKLSKLLVFPMIATMLINANYGVFQVILV